MPDREYEYLDLYLIPKPKSSEDRQHNKEQLALANSIRAKRELEIKEGKHGFVPSFKSKANFIEYCVFLNANNSPANKKHWHSMIKVLKEFGGEKIAFNTIDKKFCEDFKQFLANGKNRYGEPYSANTKRGYYKIFRAALNRAVKEEIIARSPANIVEGFPAPDSKREYLTIEEIRALFNTPCQNKILKRGFLFSCLTGMRFSDVQSIIWDSIENNNGQWRVNFRQKKTKGMEYLDINHEALELCGNKTDNENPHVFAEIKNNSHWNKELRNWCKAAGIKKHITFHSGRQGGTIIPLSLMH